MATYDETDTLLTAIYAQMLNEGFPQSETERPNIWDITERGGSFEGRLARFLTYWLNPDRNSILGTQPLRDVFQLAATRSDLWKLTTDEVFQRIQDEDVRGSDRIDASVWFESAAVFIEAKMGSREGNNQRTRYRETYTQKALERGIPEASIGFIYLTRYGQQDSAQAPWVNINYSDLLPIIEASLAILDQCPDSPDFRAAKVLGIYLEDFYLMLAGQVKRQTSSIKERFLDSSPMVLSTVAACMVAIDKGITQEEIDHVLAKFKIKPLRMAESHGETLEKAARLWGKIQNEFVVPSGTAAFKSSTQLEAIIRVIWQAAYDSPGKKVNPNLELTYARGKNALRKEAEPMKWVSENMNRIGFEQNSQMMFSFGFQADDTQWTATILGCPDLSAGRKVHFKFKGSDLRVTFEPFGQDDKHYSYEQNRRILAAAPEEFEFFDAPEPLESKRLAINVSYKNLQEHLGTLFSLLQRVCVLKR